MTARERNITRIDAIRLELERLNFELARNNTILVNKPLIIQTFLIYTSHYPALSGLKKRCKTVFSIENKDPHDRLTKQVV